LGGALGNIYDRMVYGYVFDWILLFESSIVNVADMAVIVGVVWYAIMWQQSELDDDTKTT
jgi:lipoprotein signal peptidase